MLEQNYWNLEWYNKVDLIVNNFEGLNFVYGAMSMKSFARLSDGIKRLQCVRLIIS